jgi:hypothetical protein
MSDFDVVTGPSPRLPARLMDELAARQVPRPRPPPPPVETEKPAPPEQNRPR